MIIDTEVLIRLIQEDDNLGLCTACGEEASQVEPDAEGYKCESCGAHKVSGAELLLVSGEGQ